MNQRRQMVTGRGKRGCAMRLLPIALMLAYGGYYYMSNRQEVPMTGRMQVVELSRAEEAQLGLSSYEKILSTEKVLRSGPNVDLVQKIGRDLAKVIGEDDPGFQWEFNLIDSNQANAFCLPGGKVAVYTGILPIAKNADGVAAIMGHEIAHAIARHGAERMAQSKLTQLGQMAVGAAVGDMSPQAQQAVMGAFGAGAKFGFTLPFSRDHESEADFMGLIYAARACYNPREAPELWKRMGAASGGQASSEFMSTHPSHDTRINNLNGWMPQAIAEYEKHCAAK